ncbi:MAG: hypothetical protein B6I38_03620 [Anaerolineaceae bacterium 4572_5.1]|nr:MAG: hypothetical protein B5M51_06040 [Anaerolinea sp. 4484_236]OQY33415.1 MAG: hypothetical protein B6I38_03620 [Anaerolineaceae bacterium 4572_5.1]
MSATKKKKRSLNHFPWHILFFALYPVATLLSINITEITISDSYRALYFSLFLALFLLFFLRLIVRDWVKASLLTTFYLIVFFSYGHFYTLLKEIKIGSFVLGRHSVFLPAWGILAVIGSWWLLFRLQDHSGFSKGLNLVGLVLLLIPIFLILNHQLQSISGSQVSTGVELEDLEFEGEPPDIYYIILDQYARADVFQKKYGYDNSSFINKLEEMGFYVAEKSTSNYHSTLLSLSSSLNMDYLDWLQDIYDADTNTNDPFGELISENQVFKILREEGYQLVAFKSGVYRTELRNADHFIQSNTIPADLATVEWPLNTFENLYLETTLARVIFDMRLIVKEEEIKPIEIDYELHRIEILYTLSHLGDFADQEGSYIIFAHVLAPHAPFVFGPNGEKIEHDEPFSHSPLGYNVGSEEYTQMYLDQTTYLNTLVLDAVENILENSTTPPIIIIQGDHGTAGYAQKKDIPDLNMQERHAILNAYYFPNKETTPLYPTISPVNTFRILFNTYFGSEYELLPDKNYFNPSQRQFDYIDVTDRVQSDELIP